MAESQSDFQSLKLTIDSQLCFALHSASNAIEQLYRPLLASFDLTYPQYIVLMALAERDSSSITDLAKRLTVSKATMTPLLRRLESKKLIERNLKEGNERQKAVSITRVGRALFADASVSSRQVFCASGLSKEQMDEFLYLTKLISRNHNQNAA